LAIKSHVTHLAFQIRNSILRPLQDYLQLVQHRSISAYAEGLKRAALLEAYFQGMPQASTRRTLESQARTIALWRKPEVNFNSQVVSHVLL